MPKVKQINDSIFLSYDKERGGSKIMPDEIVPLLLKYSIPNKEKVNYTLIFIKRNEIEKRKEIWGEE